MPESPIANHAFADSWSLFSTDVPPARPVLEGPMEADCVVVGGGFAGLHTALSLAIRGQRVMLLERGRFGGKASGANAGMAEAGFFVDFEELVETVGITDARQIYALSQSGVRRLSSLIQQSGRLDLLQGAEALTVSRVDQGAGFADDVKRRAERIGTGFMPVEIEEVRSLVRSPRYFQAIRDPLAIQVQPLRLAFALADMAEKHGAILHENSAVRSIRKRKAGFEIRTAQGLVKSRHVVLAGGATLGSLNGRARRSVLPIAAFMGMTEPLGDRLREVLPFRGAVSDDRGIPDYFRAIEGGRLIWGRHVSRLSMREPLLYRRRLARDIASVFPALKGVAIERSWGGVMAYAPHRMPQIGEMKPGLWLLSGLGGLGMAWSAIGGELIASAMVEEDKRIALFTPFMPRWAGGLWGRLRGQYRLWSVQYGDWDREVRG